MAWHPLNVTSMEVTLIGLVRWFSAETAPALSAAGFVGFEGTAGCCCSAFAGVVVGGGGLGGAFVASSPSGIGFVVSSAPSWRRRHRGLKRRQRWRRRLRLRRRLLLRL